jgi:hypothetical protein
MRAAWAPPPGRADSPCEKAAGEWRRNHEKASIGHCQQAGLHDPVQLSAGLSFFDAAMQERAIALQPFRRDRSWLDGAAFAQVGASAAYWVDS